MSEGTGSLVTLRFGGVEGWCRSELEEALGRVYAQYEWVFEALQRQPEVRYLQGRRPVVVGLLNGRAAVVKRLHHGGFLAPLTGDRFLSPRRALTNLTVVGALKAHGLATPEVLFVAWRRRGGVVRMEMGFEMVEGEDAAALLFGGVVRPRFEGEAVIDRVGGMVAALHRAGVLHHDLNLRNFLLTPGGEVMILDVDKVTVAARPLGALARRRNLARLTRSVRKLGRQAAPPAAVEAVVARLHAAYQAAVHGS